MANALIPKVVACSCRDSNRSTWEHQSHNVPEPWQIPIKSKEIEAFPSKTFQNHYTEPQKTKGTKRKPKKPLYRTQKTKILSFGDEKCHGGWLLGPWRCGAIPPQASQNLNILFFFVRYNGFFGFLLVSFLFLVRCNGLGRSLMEKFIFP